MVQQGHIIIPFDSYFFKYYIGRSVSFYRYCTLCFANTKVVDKKSFSYVFLIPNGILHNHSIRIENIKNSNDERSRQHGNIVKKNNTLLPY